MKKILTTALAALVAGIVIASPGDGNRNKRPGPNAQGINRAQNRGSIASIATNPRFADELGLSDEQKAKLAEIGKSERKTITESQEKIHEAMTKQTALLEANSIDEAAVMASIDEVFELRKAIAKIQTKKIIDVRAILTPEQAAKATEILKKPRRPMECKKNVNRPRNPPPKENPPEAELINAEPIKEFAFPDNIIPPPPPPEA